MGINNWLLKMEKLSYNKGFTLLETSIVLVSLSTFILILTCSHTFQNTEWYTFYNDYLCVQSKAILTATNQAFENNILESITFNAKGNVKQARTVSFPYTKSTMVISLGGGRLVEKK